MSLLSLFKIFRCVSTVFRVTKPLIFLSRFCHFCHTHSCGKAVGTPAFSQAAHRVPPHAGATGKNAPSFRRLLLCLRTTRKALAYGENVPTGAGEVFLPFFFSFHVTENRNVRATSSVTLRVPRSPEEKALAVPSGALSARTKMQI